MIPTQFDYVAPATLEEALTALAAIPGLALLVYLYQRGAFAEIEQREHIEAEANSS